MAKTFHTSLLRWDESYDTRQKLQHGYAAAAAILILAAGIVGLINYDLGQRILLVAFVCVAVFILNAVAWALLQSFILLPLDAHRAAQKQTRTPRKK